MRKPTEKEREFCRLVACEREVHTRAYIHAGYKDVKNASQNAYYLLSRPHIIAEIERLNRIIAAEKLVDRNLMTKKYFELARVCDGEKDRPTQKGCYDSICKIYGLSIDVGAAGDSAIAEITEERKRIAAAIPDEYFLQDVKLPELPAAAENSASVNAPGLTNSNQSDVNVPPVQVPPADSAQ
jgi:hypothetical protein